MSTLHGTLDKCADCPAYDKCPEEEECLGCEHIELLRSEEPCRECMTDTVCHFTPLEGVDDLGGSNE